MIPVTVRLANTNADVHVTSKLSGLSWRSVVPGGFASATFQLQQPIDYTSPMLTPFTRVYIYDGRSGDVLWEGRLAMPGRTAGDQGQVWTLTAIGPSAHTLDQTSPLVYIDRRLDNWRRSNLDAAMPPGASASVTSHPTSSQTDAVVVQFPAGQPIVNGSLASAIYDSYVGSGMEIGGIGYSWDAGATTGNFTSHVTMGTHPTYVTVLNSVPLNVAGGIYQAWVVDNFPGGKDIAVLRLQNNTGGAVTIGQDIYWVAFSNIRVIGRRLTKAGVLISGAVAHGSTSIYVWASWVVADLLGRMLPQYDGVNAIVEAADTVNIDQLCYIDAVSPSQVLDDLMKLEPNTYWAAWESNANGKYQFEWVNWDSAPRYEASVEGGFDSPAPTFEVYNSVVVRYRDARGRIKTLTRSQAIESLDALGIIREWFEDLSDEVGSAANALAFAVNFLADHKTVSSSGTLTISKPIRDIVHSRWVDPWRIVPGEVITVRGIEASQEVTGRATRDGLTTFRIVGVEARDDGTATLELDMFSPTEARALANVSKRRLRKR